MILPIVPFHIERVGLGGMGFLTPTMSSLVSRHGGTHAGAALGLESSAKSLGQVVGPLLGGVLFGAAVAIPFWLASALLLGLAPFFAWRVERGPRARHGEAIDHAEAVGGRK